MHFMGELCVLHPHQNHHCYKLVLNCGDCEALSFALVCIRFMHHQESMKLIGYLDLKHSRDTKAQRVLGLGVRTLRGMPELFVHEVHFYSKMLENHS